jgi:catechol 2,3-dioxygenase-like lactoylglutathione lyase family enzyme
MNCEIDHIVLNVDNDEKMISFYSDVLKLEPVRLDEYRAGKVAFPSLRLNANTIIDLFPKKLWANTDPVRKEGWTNLNHFCIALTKAAWEELRNCLKIMNVAVETGPVPRWGAHGNGISVYFRDPENNLIEARYYGE